MKKYNKIAHIMAIEHEIRSLQYRILAGTRILYCGVSITDLNAKQTISDLQETLNKLVTGKVK